ncbi:MAG TPA: hypothetical protein VF163_09825 [Micromonosporaceae bacterium]
MPVLDGRLLSQTLVAFAVVAMLGLVLRWAFRGDRGRAGSWPPESGATDPASAGIRPGANQPAGLDRTSPGTPGTDQAGKDRANPDWANTERGGPDRVNPDRAHPEHGGPDRANPDLDPERPSQDRPGGERTNPAPVSVSEPEDYGLLATVAHVDTVAEAARVRTNLVRAGIRATTTKSRDGRFRVLVFRSELARARRVGGGSTST